MDSRGFWLNKDDAEKLAAFAIPSEVIARFS
jgi:hypothetical protein